MRRKVASLFISPWKCGFLSLSALAVVGKAIYADFHIGIGTWEVPVSAWVWLAPWVCWVCRNPEQPQETQRSAGGGI